MTCAVNFFILYFYFYVFNLVNLRKLSLVSFNSYVMLRYVTFILTEPLLDICTLKMGNCPNNYENNHFEMANEHIYKN